MTCEPAVVIDPVLLAEAAGDRVRFWRVRPPGFNSCAFGTLSEALGECASHIKNGGEVVLEACVCERYEWDAMPEFEGY